MPSFSLPTTFSPGLFYLEALDYAGFDSKCAIDEVFNLISTSSEFMNSAILPQFIMKREYVFDIADAQLPFLFCNSLQFVRNVNISLAQTCELDDEYTIDVFRFLEFLECSGLFSFYTTTLALRYVEDDGIANSSQDKSEAEQIVFQVFRLLKKKSHLKHLKFSMMGQKILGFNLGAPLLVASYSSSLTSLELIFELSNTYDRISIESLREFTCLERLTLRNLEDFGPEDSSHREISFDWLTPGLPICRTLKSLELIKMEHMFCTFATHALQSSPLAYFRSLHCLVITEPTRSSRHIDDPEHKICSVMFGGICDAVAETLTSLTLELSDFTSWHCEHLHKLRNLRFLDIDRIWCEEEKRISDLGILPCFDILVELRLQSCCSLNSSPAQDHQCRKYLKDSFSKMKSLERLCLENIGGPATNMFDALDYIHDDAPLREVHWIDPRSNLDGFFALPKRKLHSVESLKLHIGAYYFSPEEGPHPGFSARYAQQIQEIMRLPETFPNVTSLDINFLPAVRYDSPFENVQKLKLVLESIGLRTILRQNIECGIFPNLRKLRFRPQGTVEAFLLCKELMKHSSDHFEQFDVESPSVFGTAQRASFARSLCPFVEYTLANYGQRLEEWYWYRNRKTDRSVPSMQARDLSNGSCYSDTGDDDSRNKQGNDGGDEDNRSEEHAGTRRQRD